MAGTYIILLPAAEEATSQKPKNCNYSVNSNIMFTKIASERTQKVFTMNCCEIKTYIEVTFYM